MERACIVAAKRTIIGKKNGVLARYEPEQLASVVIRALLAETRLDGALVDDVILGNVVGRGGNPARHAALLAGLPLHVPGMTIDRQCSSGLEAIIVACRLIEAGHYQFVLAGGSESCSLSPQQTRPPFAPSTIGDPEMGVAAEYVASAYGVTRAEQDEYARRSYEKAWHATENGRFLAELVSFDGLPLRDEGVRTNVERTIARAKPAFKRHGTVTAANSCGINDGASVVAICSETFARQHQLTPLLVFEGGLTVGNSPNYPGVGPIAATRELLAKVGRTVDDIALVEFNEAFASQTIASLKQLNIPWAKVNVGGGAIALGHPYGASGAIGVTRLAHELPLSSFGLTMLGVGGGMGTVALWKRL